MNVQSQPKPPAETLSIDAFFRWTETQERKYELVSGVPRLQPWVKRGHSRIVANIAYFLQTALDRDAFDIHQSDFAIETGPASIRYADILVEPAGAPNDERTTQNALLVVEVLSDSTASVDFGPKLLEYSRLATLDTYLVVSQDKRCIWQWSRAADGIWPDAPTIMENGSVAVQGLAIALPLDEVYRGVVEPETGRTNR